MLSGKVICATCIPQGDKACTGSGQEISGKDGRWTRKKINFGKRPLSGCLIKQLISSFTSMKELAKKSLRAGFSWRFLFSFGGFLEVLVAWRFFAA